MSESHIENFLRSSRTLRAWLVAFGVGLPAIILTNEGLFDRLVNAGEAGWVFGLSFAAVALQLGMEYWLKYRFMSLAMSLAKSDEQAARAGMIFMVSNRFADMASFAMLGWAGVIMVSTYIDSGTAAAITDAAATMTDAATTITDAATTITDAAATMPAVP